MEKLTLTNENIQVCVEELTKYYKKNKIDKQTILRNTFALEELLMQYQNKFGKEQEFTLYIGKRFGRHRATVSLKCDEFNPFTVTDEDTDEYCQKLMSNMGLSPEFNYYLGSNIITIKTEKHKMSSIAVLFITILASILCALFTRNLPKEISSFIPAEIVTPISDTFSGFLNAIVGPIIFFTIIASIINIGDVSSLKQFGSKVLKRLFAYSSLIFIVSSLLPFLLVGIDEEGKADSPFFILRDTLLSIIPGNIVTPFSENSILQILFWGIVIGFGLLAIDSQNSGVARGVRTFNDIFNHMMDYVTKLVPIFVFCSLYLLLCDKAVSFFHSGSVFLIYFIGMGTAFILMLLLVWIVANVSPKKLLSISYHPIMSASLACSSIISFGTTMDDLADPNKYNIKEARVKFIAPISQILFKPINSINCITILLGVIKITDTPVSFPMLFTMIVLCFIFGIAMPPSAGSGMAIMAILFKSLHLDMSYLALAITLDTLLDYICSGMNALSCIVCVLLCNGKDSKKQIDLEE